MTEPAPYPDYDKTQACYGVDTDLFFPVSPAASEIAEAMELCDGCTFRRACLAYALTHDVYGIWGGTTRPTRVAIRQQHGITAESVHASIPEPRKTEPTDDDLDELDTPDRDLDLGDEL